MKNNGVVAFVFVVQAFIVTQLNATTNIALGPAALASVYPNFGTQSNNCGACHVNTGGGGERTTFGEAVRTVATSSPNNKSSLGAASAAEIRGYLRTVGQDQGYEPRAFSLNGPSGAATSLRISPTRSATITTNLTTGTDQTGSGSSVSDTSLSPSTSLVSVQSNGNLSIGTLSEGSSASFRIILENSAGFENSTTFPPLLNIQVNNVPDFSGSTPAQTATDDNQTTRYETSALLPSFSDADGDSLSAVTSSLTIQSIRDENGLLDSGSYSLGQLISSGGIVSFLPNGFDDLNAGESRTVTFAFDVTDGFDTVGGTVSVLVEGVPETGTNVNPNVSAKTLNLAIADIPATTDLLEDDANAAFVDPDGDALTISNITPDPSTLAQFSLAGSTFSITDTAPYVALGVGQTQTDTFSYDITQTRSGTGETYLVSNTLAITVTGINDPVTASSFTASVTEGIGNIAFNLQTETGWDDPDTDDVISATNLTVVSASQPLLNDGEIALNSDGTFLNFVPSFVDDLEKDAEATLVISLDVVDGNGSTATVTGTITIIGAPVSHTTSAGLYANSIKDLYPFADFQSASNQPAACLTCHKVETDLFAPKPNCNKEADFTQFGRDLCNDDRGGNFGARLERRESTYAPRIEEANIIRYLSETNEPGYTDDTPIGFNPGKMVDGSTANLHSFLIENDFDGTFEITTTGQVRLLKAVTAGTYELNVIPRNVAGSKTASGTVRNVPGFYPQIVGFTRVVVEVGSSAPVAVNDTFNVEAGTDTTLDVLANDDGTKDVSLSVSGLTNGSATVSGGGIIYTPNPGFSGTDSFTYTSTSSDPVASSSAQVTLAVVAQGGLIAVDDMATVTKGQTVTINVLNNDTNAGANTQVTITSAPAASLGVASVSGSSIQFAAAEDLSGDVVIGYQASNPDISGVNSSQAFIRLTFASFGVGVISDVVVDPELKKVAVALEQSCEIAAGLAGDDQTAAFLNHCANIVSSTSDSAVLSEALDALRNEEHFAAMDAVEQISRGIGRSVGNRLTRVRGGGGRGFDGGGLNFSFNDTQLPNEILSAIARSALGVQSKGYQNLAAYDLDPVWGGFVSGDISISDKEDENGSGGFGIVATNLAAGVDYDLGQGRVIGAAIGFSQSDTDFSNGSTLDAKGIQATLYGSKTNFLREGLTLDGHISVGKVFFDQERVIQFGAVDTVASSSFDANYINISPQLSFRQSLGSSSNPEGSYANTLALTWFGRLEYLKVNIDGYTETGGDGLALNTRASDFESLLLALGVEASRQVYLSPNFDSTIYGSLTLNGELLDRTRNVTSSFSAAGALAPTFTLTQAGRNGIGGTVEFGTEFDFGPNGLADFAISHDISPDDVRTTTLKISYRTSLFGRDQLSLGAEAAGNNVTAKNDWNAAMRYSLDF